MKNIFLLCVLISTILFTVNISSAEGVREHRRFMKEYAQFIQGKFDCEQELRAKIKTYILAHKDMEGGYIFSKENIEVNKIVMGDYSLSEDDNAVSNYFIEHELNNKERAFFDEVSKAFGAWTMFVIAEEMAKVKVGDEMFKELKPSEDEDQNPDRIADYIKPLLKPYLTMELSQKDLSDIGYNDLWPRCKLTEKQIKTYFKDQKK